MKQLNKYRLIDMTIVDFIFIFNFISRLLYCLENDMLDDSYNRRIIKPSLNSRDIHTVYNWLKNNSLNENDITHMFYHYYGHSIKNMVNIIFIDSGETHITEVIHDFGIFKDSPIYYYIFIPRNFVKYDVKEKISTLQYIFYNLLGNRINNNILKVCELLANLLYDIPDLYNDKLKQHLNSLLECTVSGTNFINFRNDNDSITQMVEVIENYVYS